MAQTTQERQRAPAFSAAEKIRLVDCVREDADVIENKHTDMSSKKEKAEAWDRVATLFNQQATGGKICNVNQLKTLYRHQARSQQTHSGGQGKR